MAKIFQIKEVRDFGDLISSPFYYIRRHFKTLGKSVLYFVVPFIAVAGIAVSQLALSPFSINPEDVESGAYLMDMLSASFSTTIFGVLAMTVLTAVVFHHMKLVADESIENDNIQPEDIWPGVKADFLMLIVISIGVGLATMFGTLFFILPGIFIAVKLVLVSAVYIFEDVDLTEAFRRSWNLITNYWWFTFGLVIIMYIFTSLMTNVITFPFLIGSFVAGFSGFENPEQAMGPIFSIFYGLTTSLSYIFYTLMYVCLGLHYFSLVERKEGKALSERIDQIDDSSETLTY